VLDYDIPELRSILEEGHPVFNIEKEEPKHNVGLKIRRFPEQIRCFSKLFCKRKRP